MFLINNEQKPDATYKVISITSADDTVEASVKKALEKLEIQINTIGGDDVLATLIGCANISVTAGKEKYIIYYATASQTVLIRQY